MNAGTGGGEGDTTYIIRQVTSVGNQSITPLGKPWEPRSELSRPKGRGSRGSVHQLPSVMGKGDFQRELICQHFQPALLTKKLKWFQGGKIRKRKRERKEEGNPETEM